MVTITIPKCNMSVTIFDADIYMKFMDLVAGRIEPYIFLDFLKVSYPSWLNTFIPIVDTCFPGIAV
jgi:hypothetical protein